MSANVSKGSVIRKAAPLAAALLLAGCISFSPKPPASLISLTATATAPAGDFASPSSQPPLVVLAPEGDREVDVLRVPVRVSPSSVAYLKNAMWVEKPARQLRAVLAETIRAKDNRLVFEGIDAPTGGSAVLSGRLVAMGYDVPSGSVVIRLDAQLAAPGAPLRERRFEASVPGVAADAASVGPALNRAANDLAAQVADWVR